MKCDFSHAGMLNVTSIELKYVYEQEGVSDVAEGEAKVTTS